MNERLIALLLDSFPKILLPGLTMTIPLTILSFTFGLILALLAARKAALPQLPAEDALAGMLHPRLGKTLCRACGLGQQSLAGVPDEALAALAKKIKNFALPVTGVSGFESAQVTAGGVRTAEFRADTLESRLAPGVFACGEVLDIDGDCGGYNLQWAWSSGYVAGMLGKQEEPR